MGAARLPLRMLRLHGFFHPGLPRRLHLMKSFMRWLGKRPRAARASHCPITARPRVEALEDRQVPTVLYYGGNLLPHVEAQPLFLGNAWASNPSQTSTINS